MDTSKVDELFDDKDLANYNTFRVPGSDYAVKNLRVIVQYVVMQSGGGRMGGTTRTRIIYNTCRLVFQRGKLVFWGFDYELNMSSDPEIRSIAKALKSVQRTSEEEE